MKLIRNSTYTDLTDNLVSLEKENTNKHTQILHLKRMVNEKDDEIRKLNLKVAQLKTDVKVLKKTNEKVTNYFQEKINNL